MYEINSNFVSFIFFKIQLLCLHRYSLGDLIVACYCFKMSTYLGMLFVCPVDCKITDFTPESQIQLFASSYRRNLIIVEQGFLLHKLSCLQLNLCD